MLNKWQLRCKIMKTLFQIIVLVCCFAFTGCEQINNLIVKHNLQGVYKDAEGNTMEFTESKVIFDDRLSFDYKVEGKHVFLENVRFGAYNFGDVRYEIIDANTLKISGGFWISKDEVKNEKGIFRKVLN